MKKIIKKVKAKQSEKTPVAKTMSAPTRKTGTGDQPSHAREQSGEAFDEYAQRCCDVDRQRLENMLMAAGPEEAPSEGSTRPGIGETSIFNKSDHEPPAEVLHGGNGKVSFEDIVNKLREMGYGENETHDAVHIAQLHAGGTLPTIDDVIAQIGACRVHNAQMPRAASFQSSQDSSVLHTPNSGLLRSAMLRPDTQELLSPTEPAETPNKEPHWYIT